MDDFYALLQRLQEASTSWQNLLASICYILGGYLAVSAIKLAGDVSERGEQSNGFNWRSAGVRFFAGVLLLGLPAMVATMGMTIFGLSSPATTASIFDESATVQGMFSDSTARTALLAVLTFVQAVGLTGIARGIYKLNRAAEEPGREHFGAALTHIIAGACAWYIGPFVGAVDKFLFGS